MATIARTAATLRLFGDALDPDEVTRLLGAPPTASARTGEVRQSAGGHTMARFGSWRLSAPERSPGDLSAQVRAILAGLTDDLAVWRDLNARFTCDVFCGLFLEEANEGETLAPDVLRLLGERGLKLDLDLYWNGTE